MALLKYEVSSKMVIVDNEFLRTYILESPFSVLIFKRLI